VQLTHRAQLALFVQ